MRIRQLDKATPRPSEAAVFLQREQHLDDEIRFDPKRDISPDSWKGMKGRLDEDRQAKNWWNFSTMAMHLAILFPDRRAELNLDDDAWKGMKGRLDEDRQAKNWWDFSVTAMNLAVLFPDRRAELNLDDDAWKGMKEVFDMERRNENWMNYSEEALNLAILAAKDARITKDGRIEIVPMKPRLKAEPSPLPSRHLSSAP